MIERIDRKREVLVHVAKYCFEGTLEAHKEFIPLEIVPHGSQPTHRCCVYREREVLRNRVDWACGRASVYDGENHYTFTDEPVAVMNSACEGCPLQRYTVTSNCQHCMAKRCLQACRFGAITMTHQGAIINPDKCRECGMCAQACPYNAIVKVERPCAKACGVGAIRSDEHGRADIDYNKCVSCGMCLVNCPFGAIVDKGQIFQLIQSIKRGDEVIAIVAPAFVNQFPNMTPAKLREAMKRLGFANTAEVAIGADLCTIDEAHDFLEEVPSKHPFMGTSCCPAWSVMAKKNFPKFADCISMAMTPMVLTARLLKQDHPAARICFVGPCAAKKLEASRHSVRSEVDFVLTFEELMGMFEAKQINFDDLPDDPNDNFNNASADGRGFAVSGGVAQAVVNVIKKEDPTREVKVVSAQGLAECKKMMQLAAAGKYNGYLLEGMACPGGCIAGAGTLADPARSAMMLNKYKAQATMKTAADTPYKDTLDKLKY